MYVHNLKLFGMRNAAKELVLDSQASHAGLESIDVLGVADINRISLHWVGIRIVPIDGIIQQFFLGCWKKAIGMWESF